MPWRKIGAPALTPSNASSHSTASSTRKLYALQRALELGLARSDPRARNLITSAMVSAAVADADGVQPNNAKLEAFYEKERSGTPPPPATRPSCRSG